MKKLIASLILKIVGWKIVLDGPKENLNRCILVTVPHTHNSEYILGNLAFMVLDKPLKIIIKDTHTKAWYGGLVKSIGGIGVNRSQKNDLVQFVVDEFKKQDFALVITPEGTRSYVEKWRKGFYFMAKEAQVPICLAMGDYKRKIMILAKTITVEEINSLTYEEILDIIRAYIVERDVQPAVKENWNINFT